MVRTLVEIFHETLKLFSFITDGETIPTTPADEDWKEELGWRLKYEWSSDCEKEEE